MSCMHLICIVFHNRYLLTIKIVHNNCIFAFIPVYLGIVATEYYSCEITHIIYRWKTLGTRKPKPITFFAWRDAIDHNGIGILNLVWAVTSEPMKIKSRFFLLICDQGMTWESDLECNKYRYVTMYLQRYFEGKQFLSIFQ